MTYTINKPIEAKDIPSWVRRVPAWQELTELVLNLKPGEALPVDFDSKSQADSARNGVRDTINNEILGIAAVRTRLSTKGKKFTVYLALEDTPEVHAALDEYHANKGTDK